jgi:hypothetical protein
MQVLQNSSAPISRTKQNESGKRRQPDGSPTPRFFLVILMVMTAIEPRLMAAGPEEPPVEKYLLDGKLAEGEKALADAVAARPADAQARFGLGVIQFVSAVERMVRTFHRYGLRTGALGNVLPFARLPIPVNPHPEPIRYADLRALFERWTTDLALAEATLAKVDADDVKLPLHFGLIRLDLNGDGKAEPDERLFSLYAELNAAARNQVTPEAAKEFIIAFDRADVAWLRGYCHLLMAMGEVYLAHDAHELFDHTAPFFYPRAETPFPFLRRSPHGNAQPFETDDILDAVAFIHLVRFPVQEAARLQAALAHLESMIALSHESWKFILAETDDDHEWVPSPKQHSVLPNGTVTVEMVKGWLEFLDEARSILKGEKLIPFWRSGPESGVNLRRVFTEPRTLDLVLWVQGTAAAPYLQNGVCSSAETWNRLQRIFRGEFIGFALWFN